MLLGHHAEGYFTIEILGRDFPDGPMEHALGFGISAVVLVLVVYGAFALVRDLIRWRRRARA
jgi:hypothetical protein